MLSVFFFALGLLAASLSTHVWGTGARKALRVESWLRWISARWWRAMSVTRSQLTTKTSFWKGITFNCKQQQSTGNRSLQEWQKVKDLCYKCGEIASHNQNGLCQWSGILHDCAQGDATKWLWWNVSCSKSTFKQSETVTKPKKTLTKSPANQLLLISHFLIFLQTMIMTIFTFKVYKKNTGSGNINFSWLLRWTRNCQNIKIICEDMEEKRWRANCIPYLKSILIVRGSSPLRVSKCFSSFLISHVYRYDRLFSNSLIIQNSSSLITWS